MGDLLYMVLLSVILHIWVCVLVPWRISCLTGSPSRLCRACPMSWTSNVVSYFLPMPSIPSVYTVAQKLFSKSTLKYVKNFFITYRIYKNCSKWAPPCSVHSSQCCDAILGSNLNIPVNARECFMLIDFRAPLYFPFYMFLMYVVVFRNAASAYDENHRYLDIHYFCMKSPFPVEPRL
jgi:hypothetical protein